MSAYEKLMIVLTIAAAAGFTTAGALMAMIFYS
jgi:hypothetical protein